MYAVSASLWLSWQESVSLSASDGCAVVAGPASRIAWRAVAPEIVAAMRRLDPPGDEEQRLAESVLAGGSVHSLARWFHYVDELSRRGLIRRSLVADGTLMATVVPLGRDLGPTTRAGSAPARLSAAGHSSRTIDASHGTWRPPRWASPRARWAVEIPIGLLARRAPTITLKPQWASSCWGVENNSCSCRRGLSPVVRRPSPAIGSGSGSDATRWTRQSVRVGRRRS